MSRTRSPSSQRARAKVDETPFASLNATRRKLTPGTWLAISALHLVENRLDVAAAGLQWTSFSRLPRSILAIAAGAVFEHLALPRNWPDRSISLDKGVSHRDSPRNTPSLILKAMAARCGRRATGRPVIASAGSRKRISSKRRSRPRPRCALYLAGWSSGGRKPLGFPS